MHNFILNMSVSSKREFKTKSSIELVIHIIVPIYGTRQYYYFSIMDYNLPKVTHDIEFLFDKFSYPPVVVLFSLFLPHSRIKPTPIVQAKSGSHQSVYFFEDVCDQFSR